MADAAAYVSDLFGAGWIDRHTRALVLDLTIMNVDLGYITVVKLVSELSPVGQSHTQIYVQSMPLQVDIFDYGACVRAIVSGHCWRR
eukprot:SAG11_NODE_11477_length_758_cov_1.006070_1_plen_86_part_01